MTSRSVREQQECEAACAKVSWSQSDPKLSDAVSSLKRRHVAYLERGLFGGLGPSYVSLDASRPWLCYWILHSLHFFVPVSEKAWTSCVETLRRCQNASGGFGGGPGQLSHCAPTYAAVLALCSMGQEAAFEVIDRESMYRWFLSLKKSGGFRLHVDGEVDVRGTYTVIAVAALLGILTPELVEGAADFVLSCQTYEGGFGGEPGDEAHGGYTFCAVAALVALGKVNAVKDIDALERWLCRRQLAVEGGFQGRTNKLVDGCYSFWQGGAVALLEIALGHAGETNESLYCPSSDELPCDPAALERYILLCSQDTNGGFRDKPGSNRDYYHTCYCLSGLAAVTLGEPHAANYDHPDRLSLHHVFNIRHADVNATQRYFQRHPFTPPPQQHTSSPPPSHVAIDDLDNI